MPKPSHSRATRVIVAQPNYQSGLPVDHRHVYLFGSDLGTAFAPPDVFLGYNAQVKCNVQAFTSTKNRLHCLIGADGVPAATTDYYEPGDFVSLPFRVLKNGRYADCWHKGGTNHDCFARFDTAGTRGEPNSDHPLAPLYRMRRILISS